MDDLVREARENPGKINYASSGFGSIQHVIMAGLAYATDTNMVHVPFKGVAEAVPALLSGDVPVMVSGYDTIATHVQAGVVRILATAGNKRIAAAPNVPAIAEFLKEGFVIDSRIGLLGPANMPTDFLGKLSNALKTAIESPDLREAISANGTRSINWTSPLEYAESIRSNIEKFDRIVAITGIRQE